MCGRYSLSTNIEDLAYRFDFKPTNFGYQTRFNISPTQQVLAVTKNDSGNQAMLMKWGLIPSWTKDPSISNRMINARAETLTEKPAFRNAFLKRRCMIIADGFYEWTRHKGDKTPIRVTLKSGEAFGFAGLWETWRSPDNQEIQSCTIITTYANDLMKTIHDRMPVILTTESERLWLDYNQQDPKKLKELLIPYESIKMETQEVTRLINSTKNDHITLV